jgi:hypothetical protein
MALVTAMLLATWACSEPRTPVNAPVDLAIAPIGTLPEGGIATNGERSPATGRCSVRLVAARIEKSSPGCYLDEHITGASGGVLQYPCNGDGPAEATFGTQKYTGKIEHGDVELEASTELDWEDGCRWGTDAVITGSVVIGNHGELARKRLAWKYRDRVITGNQCSGLCTAKSSFDVTTTEAAPGRRSHDDDVDDDVDD